MPRYSYMQNSFSSGQLSPKLEGRSDIAEYKNGVSELTNFFPQRSGGISKRPGFRYKNSYAIADPASTQTQIPFQLDLDNTFNLIIFTENVQPDFEVEIINSQYTTVTPVFSVVALSALSIPGINAGTLQFAQVDDKIIIVDSSGKLIPLVVTTTPDLIDPTNIYFNLTTITDAVVLNTNSPFVPFVASIPMTDANTTATTMQLTDLGAGRYRLTCSDAKFVSTDTFQDYLLDGSNATTVLQAFFHADTYVDANNLEGQLSAALDGYPVATVTNYWYEPSWSAERGYPRSVSFFENRLVFGGNKAEPSTLWFSEMYQPFQLNRWAISRNNVSGGIFVYGRTPDQTALSDAIDSSFILPMTMTIASNRPDAILWISATSHLLIGTTNREYVISGGENGLSVTSFQVRPQTSIGGKGTQPVEVDSSVYFVSKDGKSIHQLSFSGESGAYLGKNISTLSDDILYGETEDRDDRYKKLVWQSTRNLLWATTEKGKLIAISINQGGIGFCSVAIDMAVEDVVSHISADKNYEELTIIGKRSEFEAIKTYTAVLVDDFEHPVLFNTSTYAGDKPMYLDFSLNLTGASSVNWNVSPFHDEQVTVLTKEGNVEVVTPNASGDIVLATATTEIIVGLPYTAKMKTLNLETGVNQLANAQQDIQRVDRVTAKLYKTWAGQYGALSDGDETIYDMELTGTSGETKPIQLDMPMTPSNDNRMIIQSDEPLPLTISGLVYRGVNNQ